MSQTLSISDTLQGGGSISDDATDASMRIAYGGAVLPAISMQTGYGTGDNQANRVILERRTLAAATMDSIDLEALTDYQGDAVNLATVRRVLVAIIDPDGTKELRVGPQSQANALDGFWGDASDYERVWHHTNKYRPITGVTVDATHKVLAVYNPGASEVTYAILILGTE